MTAQEMFAKSMPSQESLVDKTWDDILTLTKVPKDMWKKVAEVFGDDSMDDFNEIILLTPEMFHSAFEELEVKPIQRIRMNKTKTTQIYMGKV